MYHEHTGDCCPPLNQAVQFHEHSEHHEHSNAALSLGHVCTGACLHEAAELHALAVLRAEHAMVDRLQAGQAESPAKEKQTKMADKHKKSKRRQRLGAFGLVALAPAV